MGKIGFAGLALVGENLWLQLLWLFALIAITFGPAFLLFRRLTRNNKPPTNKIAE
jgi:hypothetical protein